MNIEDALTALKAEREKAWWEWNELEILTYEKDYEESYEDTVARLGFEGVYDGLGRAIELLENKEAI